MVPKSFLAMQMIYVLIPSRLEVFRPSDLDVTVNALYKAIEATKLKLNKDPMARLQLKSLQAELKKLENG